MSADQVERKLTAIFAADVEGYSRLMGIDEVGTLRTLTAYREIIDNHVAQHRGRIFNTAGDSVLAEFASVVDALRCAVEVQRALAEQNESELADKQMRFRIGVHIAGSRASRTSLSRCERSEWERAQPLPRPILSDRPSRCPTSRRSPCCRSRT
jgi:class 3 adenylate cyclase